MPGKSVSILTMFLEADPVVQAVMIILIIASLLTWAIIIEKAVTLKCCLGEFRKFKLLAKEILAEPEDPETLPEMTQYILLAGLAESQEISVSETRSDFRFRLEGVMRLALLERIQRLRRRSNFLASVGSTSPFIGLFGTVWGIMHSFIGIAATGETTLAVVAPGIAEALSATALGLVAAIPAVLAYNMVIETIKNISREALAAVSIIGNRLASWHFPS
jgi:biopolymer transport protein ExbB/TolQ